MHLVSKRWLRNEQVKVRSFMSGLSRLILMVTLMAGLTVSLAPLSAQQPDAAVSLTVQLRAADGAAVVGEMVTLQQLPEGVNVAPVCTTDALGVCTWYVERGLYQALFARPLDEVSALALAEGGLRGFGLTVGEEEITYHFTLHSDGRVYFDAAPDAAIPVPIIPTAEHLHGGAQGAATPQATGTSPATKEAALVASDEMDADDGAVEDSAPVVQADESKSSAGAWRFLALAATGLIAGSGLHWWAQRRGRRRADAGARSRRAVDNTPKQGQDDA